jgi:hypothetical protein
MHLLPRHRIDSPYPHRLRSISFNTALLAAIAFAGMAVSDGGAIGQALHNSGPPRPNMRSDSQDETRSPRLQEDTPAIDVSAFNQERKKELAKDSERLLALTAALKTELDGDPSKIQSEDVAQKIKEIEKLAHRVKEKMLADPTPSTLSH